MPLPSAPNLTRIPGLNSGLHGLASLAAFVRDRLSRRSEAQLALTEGSSVDAARELEVAIMAAAAPFAPTSFARARLLRQMHACGLLTPQEADQAEDLFGVAQ